MIFSKIENGQISDTREVGVKYPNRLPLIIGGSKLSTPNTEEQFISAGRYKLVPAVVGPNQVQLSTFTTTEDPRTYTFDVRDKTQEELDAEAQAEADATELENETASSPLTGVTFAQVDAYVEANVTDLASAKTLLKKYGKAILILNRQLNI